jgi:hypothetical protein
MGDQWGPPVAPAKKGGSGVLITVVVVLAVLLCGGGAAGAYFVLKDDTKTEAGTDPTTGPSPSGSTTGRPSPSATSRQPTTAAPTTPSGGDVRTLKAGDCFINQGTDAAPKIVKVACAAGTFNVLKRIDGTSDKTKCTGTKDYTHDYYYKTSSEATSFVLCLKIVA